MATIYISTDSNEVRGILEPRKLEEEGFVRGYFFTKDKIKIDKFFQNTLFNYTIITNIPIFDGKIIQDKAKLKFNPMSIISGDLIENETGNLIKKLVKENGLFIAISNNKGEIKHHLPNKYDGYQGEGFI